jgi:predicted phosphodiesterase
MRVAVLSDIHGNRHALEAVLTDVAESGATDLWCLGDVVGYGAEPNACVELVVEHAALCLAGNHDLAVTGALPLEDFSKAAALAARWTQEELAREGIDFLAGLASAGEAGPIGLYHASPRDPVWEYVISELLAELCFDEQTQRIGLIGHSHVALSFVRPDGEPAQGDKRAAGDVMDLRTGEWLLNPGSVGQPRDGDPRAAWMLLDTDSAQAEWRRTAYDVDGAATAIRRAGLPHSLADRLEFGQ